jgi:hypothetical protein
VGVAPSYSQKGGIRRLVNASLIVGGLLAISTAYGVYKITPELASGIRSVYVGGPAAVGILFLLSCFLSLEAKSRILLSAIGAVFGLYLAEVLSLWVTVPTNDKIKRAALEAGRPYDPRSRFEAYVDLKTKDPEATIYVTPLYTLAWDYEGLYYRPVIKIDGRDALPLGGQSKRQTLYCNENGQYITFHSDEHGFRNPRGIWGSEDIQVVILGDSFGNAACVEEENSHTHAIRTAYPRTLNLSASANGPPLALAYMREYVQHLKPKLVIWMFFEGNDMDNLNFEKKVPLLLEYLKDRKFEQGLIRSQDKIDAALERFINEKMSEYRQSRDKGVEQGLNLGARGQETPLSGKIVGALLLRNLRGMIGLPVLSRDLWSWAEPLDLDYAMFEQILVQAHEMTSKWGGRLIFVYLPAWYRGRTPSTVNAYLQAIHGNVQRIVKQNGVPFLDLTAAFAAHPKPRELIWYEGSHYSATGYQLVGREVVQFLKSLEK